MIQAELFDWLEFFTQGGWMRRVLRGSPGKQGTRNGATGRLRCSWGRERGSQAGRYGGFAAVHYRYDVVNIGALLV